MNHRIFGTMLLAIAILLALPFIVSAAPPFPIQNLDQVDLSAMGFKPDQLASSLLDLTPTATPPAGICIRIKFKGTITSIESGNEFNIWKIDVPGHGEIPVVVTDDTVIDKRHGPAGVGARVEVKACLELIDGGPAFYIVAHKIEVKPPRADCEKIEFYGEFTGTETDGTTGQVVWLVTGHDDTEYRVIITDSTRKKGDPQIGDIVIVKGCLQDDGTVVAREVKVRRRHHDDDGEVEFRGCIKSVSDNQIEIGHWTVLITSDTEWKGAPIEVNKRAEVEGHMDDHGNVVAEKIEVEGRCGNEPHSRIEIEGYITAVPEDDTAEAGQVIEIQGIPVRITDDTVTHGAHIQVDAWAKADVILPETPAVSLAQTDVVYTALRIRTSRSHKPENMLKFKGQLTHIDEVGSMWTISGWPFYVDPETEIKNNPAVNDWVKLTARYNSANGTHTILEIKSISDRDDDDDD